jgi:DMSO/TMAO reductase YedYZ heme-binding membrane subunit
MQENPYQPPNVPSDHLTQARRARGVTAVAIWTVAFMGVMVMISPTLGVPTLVEIGIFAAIYLLVATLAYVIFSRALPVQGN